MLECLMTMKMECMLLNFISVSQRKLPEALRVLTADHGVSQSLNVSWCIATLGARSVVASIEYQVLRWAAHVRPIAALYMSFMRIVKLLRGNEQKSNKEKQNKKREQLTAA